MCLGHNARRLVTCESAENRKCDNKGEKKRERVEIWRNLGRNLSKPAEMDLCKWENCLDELWTLRWAWIRASVWNRGNGMRKDQKWCRSAKMSRWNAMNVEEGCIKRKPSRWAPKWCAYSEASVGKHTQKAEVRPTLYEVALRVRSVSQGLLPKERVNRRWMSDSRGWGGYRKAVIRIAKVWIENAKMRNLRTKFSELYVGGEGSIIFLQTTDMVFMERWHRAKEIHVEQRPNEELEWWKGPRGHIHDTGI
jgi:hypothetical protein